MIFQPDLKVYNIEKKLNLDKSFRTNLNLSNSNFELFLSLKLKNCGEIFKVSNSRKLFLLNSSLLLKPKLSVDQKRERKGKLTFLLNRSSWQGKTENYIELRPLINDRGYLEQNYGRSEEIISINSRET